MGLGLAALAASMIATVVIAVDGTTLRAQQRAQEPPSRRTAKRSARAELDRLRAHRVLMGVALATLSAIALVACMVKA